jgi:ATP-dependent RNA helicase DDX24/MAK5
MGQKRGHDSKAQALESKKRKKAAKSSPASDDSGWDGIVGLGDLNWKEVAMPDRMEDAGGFFGLEEIDGVDVIRSQGSGEVRFKVWKYILLSNPPQVY